MALSDGEYMASYLIALVVFALPLIVYVIFANQIKWKKFDLKIEGQGQGGEKRNLRHSIGNVRFHIIDFF